MTCSTGHPGIVRMKELARSYLRWPSIDQEIEQTVRNCASCQQVRILPAVAPLSPWLWPSNPGAEFISITLKTKTVLISSYSGCTLPLARDLIRATKHSATVTISIVRNLFAKYGLPVHYVSDNGRQFRSEEFAHFLRMDGV